MRRPPNLRFCVVGLCLVLAACGTPQERCVSSVTRDLRVVDRLIAETEANLARGYALVNQTVYVPTWQYCNLPVVVQPADGGQAVVYPAQLCLDDQPTTIRRAVAIDLEAERRQLVQLQDQRRKLATQAAPAIAQCAALYPA